MSTGTPKTQFSDTWHRSFLQRNEDLFRRITHASNRKKEREWDYKIFRNWLTLLGELHMQGYLEDPRGLWNLDKSAFQLAEAVCTIYCEKGSKNVLSYMDDRDCDLLTALACGNAAREMVIH